MNPAGRAWHAANQLITHGTRAAESVAAPVRGAWGALSRTLAPVVRPAGMRGIAVETGVLIAHLMMYPWGALTQPSRPGGATGTPILLVHGFADNRSVFALLSRALRKRGFGVVHSLNYSVLTALTGDVRSAARELGDEVERICAVTGAEQVHVVGHSLGGLIARYYVQRQGGDSRVHTLITLGTPHSGTMTAYLLPTPVLRQLRPDSDILLHTVTSALARLDGVHRGRPERPYGA